MATSVVPEAGSRDLVPGMPNDSRKQHKSTATGDDILAGVPAFPDEYPQAHEAAEWLEKYENRIGKLHLQAVRDGKLPLRVQHLKNWPEEFLAVPEEVLVGRW